MLAFSLNQTKESNGADFLNNGFDTNYPIGDGACLISALHPVAAGGYQSNVLANASDLSEAALEDMLVQISLTKNSRGLIVNNVPELLVVSAYDAFNAPRILNSPLNTTDAGNAINAVRYLGSLPKGYTVNHYLTDTDAWFIKTNMPEGLTLYQRENYQFVQDNDGDTMNAKAKAWERYRFGIGDWRGIYGTPGS